MLTGPMYGTWVRCRRVAMLCGLVCPAIALIPTPIRAQDGLPAELRAQAELAQTVADLVRRKGAFDRAYSDFVNNGSLDNKAWDEWYSALDKVGNFVLGYVLASADHGESPLSRECKSFNSFDLGEAAIDRLIAAEGVWRRKWVQVLREWMIARVLFDEDFEAKACGP